MSATVEQKHKRGERWLRWHRDMEQCDVCELAHCNVQHAVDAADQIEGPAYHAEISHHPFVWNGRWVDGFDRVSGYVTLREAQPLVEAAR